MAEERMITVHDATECMERTMIHFKFFKLNGGVFAYVGDKSASFSDLAVAFPTKFDAVPTGVPLWEGSDDASTTDLARKLSKRFEMPVWLSVNVKNGGGGDDVDGFITRKLVEHIANRDAW